MRDIQQRAAEGRKIIRKHPRVDLNLDELNALIDIFNDKDSKDGGLIKALIKSFEFGVSVGARVTK